MNELRARRAWLLGVLLCLCAGVAQAQDVPYIGDGTPKVVATVASSHCALKPDGTVRCFGLAPGTIPSGSFVSLYSNVGGTYCALRADGTAACFGAASLISSALPAAERFKSLALGAGGTSTGFACGLRATGVAVCWGNNAYGQTSVPAGESFTTLAAGYYNVCGLRTNGSAVCWGAGTPGTPTGTSPHYAQGIPPADKTFVAIASGEFNGCGLQADGLPLCWGRSNSAAYQRINTPPAGEHFSAIAMGRREVCGMDAGGNNVSCWGNFLNNLHPADNEHFIAIAGGLLDAFIGLRSDGSVMYWDNGSGQTIQNFGQTEVPAGQSFIQVSAGFDFACGLHADGTVLCWTGVDNDYGQLDIPAAENHGFISIGSGDLFTCGLRADHSYACWGYDQAGPLYGYILEAPAGATFSHLSVGGYHVCGSLQDAYIDAQSVAHEAGSIMCWGNDTLTAVAGGPYIPFPAGETFDPASLVGESAHACGLRASDHTAVCWGEPTHGQPVPADVFTTLGAGFGYTCGVRASDATAVCWGTGYNGPTPPQPAQDRHFLSVAPGINFGCGLLTDHSVYCWGDNGLGQLNAPGGTDFVQVSSGDNYSCALRANGEGLCWGAEIPAEAFAGPYGFGKVAAGSGHTCDLAANGGLSCTGSNADGQASAPAGTFKDVAAGERFSCAVAAEGGSAVCWGSDDDSRASPPVGAAFAAVDLGAYNGCAWADYGVPNCWGLDNYDQSSPPLPPAGRLYRQINPGPFHSCGVYDDNSGECWGYDYTTAGATQSVPSGSWLALSPGYNFTCGLKTDGTLQCWGDDSNGIVSNTPGSSYRFRALSVGAAHACAIRNIGTLVCWGSNAYGATQRPGGTYISVSSGEFHSCAVRSDGERVCWGETSDTTGPTITGQTTGTLGNNGWYTSDVGVAWTVSDTKSAVRATTGCGSSGVYSDSPGATVTCTATSAGGTSSKSVSVKRDTTPPMISAAATTAPSASGWYKGSVVVKFTCTDATSGVASCPAPESIDGEGMNLTSPDRYALDKAGNQGGPSTAVSVNIDRTKPTLGIGSVDGTPGSNGWYTSNVTIHYACDDNLSGIPLGCPAGQVVTGRGASVAAASRTVTDGAGWKSDAFTPPAFKIDSTAPTFSGTMAYSPQVGNGQLLLNADVSVSALTAADAQSGIDSVACGAVDTSTIGSHAGATCTATNLAGLSAAKTAPAYKVVYAVVYTGQLIEGGYYQADVQKPLRVQWQVSDANGGVAGLAAGQSLVVSSVACPAGTPAVIGSYEVSAQNAVQDAGGGSYWRTYQASNSSAGTCRKFTVKAGDGVTSHVVTVKYVAIP